MNKTLYKQIVSLCFLCILTSCATTGDEAPAAVGDVDYNGSDCIWIRSIRDYTPLDDQTLLIWESSKRPYYVRLQQRSFEMRSAIGMSVDSRDDRLCPYGGDGLVFGSFDPRPLGVRSISRITVEQADEFMVRYGKKDAGEPTTPAPQDVEGADVEELD
jgi:hypothetical protein